MNSNLFAQALYNSKAYISNLSKFEKILSKLKLENLPLIKQINTLKKYECDDIQIKTDINIFIRNLEKLNETT